MATKTKKRRTKKAAKVEASKFEFHPLPPDYYEKVTVWDTPDGKAPQPRACRVAGCRNTTIDSPFILCDEHLGRVINYVQTGTARFVAKNGGPNHS